MNPAINAATGLVRYMQRDYEHAIEAVEEALELDPTHPLCNITLGWAYVESGRYAEALAAFERCQVIRVVATGGRAWAYALAGEQDQARELLDELQQMSAQGNSQADFEMARVHIAFGDIDRAFDCLNRTFAERGGTLFWLNVNPLFDPLRSDPRFNALLEKMGLSAE